MKLIDEIRQDRAERGTNRTSSEWQAWADVLEARQRRAAAASRRAEEAGDRWRWQRWCDVHNRCFRGVQHALDMAHITGLYEGTCSE